MYAASLFGHVDVVRILTERGADINKALNDGTTPLQITDHTEIIQLLQLAAQNQLRAQQVEERGKRKERREERKRRDRGA